MELLISTLETVGTLLIAWAALGVHHRVLNEHKISSKVFKVMRVEQKFGMLGIILVVIGYTLNILY